MACIQDQINSDVVIGNFGLRRSASEKLLLAQKFIAGITGGACSAQVDLSKLGSPTGNIWVEVWTDNAGVPGTKIGGNSDVVDVSTLTGSQAYITFPWSANYAYLTNGTNYWLVLNGDYTPSTTNLAQWGVNNNSSFSDIQSFDGVSWGVLTTWKGRFSISVDSTHSPSPSASISASNSPSPSGFQPDQFSFLKLWLKADTILGLNDGDQITTWGDSSGLAHNATGSGATKPVLKKNIIGIQPVVRFSGSNGFTLGTLGTNESDFDLATYSIYIVASRTSGNTVISKNTTAFTDGRRRKLQVSIPGNLTLANGADSNSINTAATTSNYNIYSVIARANNDHDLNVNGVKNNKTTTLADDTFNDAQVEIGQAFSNGAERLTGDIAEIIVYSGAHIEADRLLVEQYLSDKFGISIASASASPSSSSSKSASPSSSISSSPSASASPSASDSPSGSPSASVSPSASTSFSPSASISPSASVSPSASTSVSPSASVSPSPGIGNLFPNPSFESGLSGWTLDPDFGRQDADAFDGDWSIKQVSVSGFANFTTQNDSGSKIPVIKGANYVLSFYYKLQINSGNPPQVEIHDDTPFAGNVLASSTLTASPDWIKKQIFFTSNSSGFVTFRLFNNNGNVVGLYDLFDLELTGISPSASASPSASLSPSSSVSRSFSPSASASPSSSLSPSIPPPAFVERVGDQFHLNNERFRGVFVNKFQLFVGGMKQAQLQTFFAACVADGIKVVRTWGFDISSLGQLHRLQYPLTGTNLVTNGTFESNSTSWTLGSGFSRSSDAAHTGTFAIKQVSAGGFANFHSDAITVTPGTDYVLTFWYKVQNTFSFPDVLFIDKVTPTAAQLVDAGFLGDTGGQWVQKQLKFNTGVATSISVRINNFGGGVNAFFDDFDLELATAPSLTTIEGGYQRLDLVLSEARNAGVKLILSLMDSNEFNYNSKHTFVSWANQIYPGINLTDSFPYSAFFTSSYCRTLYQQTISDIVNRVNSINGYIYKNDDTIFSWELGNEIRYNSSDPNINTLQSSVLAAISLPSGWADVMSTYIRSLDSNHLIGFGDMSHTWQYANGDWVSNGTYYGVDYDYLTQLPNIDYGDFHLYPNQGNGPNIHIFGVRFGYSSVTATAGGFVAQIQDYVAVAKRNDKPIIIGEYGYAREEIASNTVIPQYPRVNAFSYLFNIFFTAGGDCIFLWNAETNDGGSFSVNITGTWNGDITNQNYDDRPVVALITAENIQIISASASISPSISPSASLSPSASVSPSIPPSLFTKQSIGSLPSNKNDLGTTYTPQEIIDVEVIDGIGVPIEGIAPTYLMHQYKIRHENNHDAINVTLTLQTTLAPTASPVYLQIWNVHSLAWETIAVDNDSLADTPFTITGVIVNNLSYYYDEVSDVHFSRIYTINEIAVRVYQNNPV